MQAYDISRELTTTLRNDQNFSFKETNKVFNKGKCPECGRKSAWIKKDNPKYISCDHASSCGYWSSVRSLYPYLFENFTERHPVTDEDKKATARAYLAINRGFRMDEIADWYDQGFRKLPGGGYAPTVRFWLFGGNEWYWERIIDKKHVTELGDKAYFKKGVSLSGKHWSPPTQTLSKYDRVFIVEGIFHAIALWLSGYKAIAGFSCTFFPTELIDEHKGQDITWVLAYDDEPSAKKHMLKYIEQLDEIGEKYEVALTGSKDDWDDLYRAEKLNDEFIAECLWRGRVYKAKDIKEKAYVLFGWKARHYMVEEFKNKLYSLKVDSDSLNRGLSEGETFQYGMHKDVFLSALKIEPISNCVPRFLYIERNPYKEEGQKYFYHVDMAFSSKPVLVAFEASATNDPRNFSNALLNKTPGGRFDGSAKDLRILNSRWFDRRIDYVSTIDFVGYEPETQAYVFNEYGFRNGHEIDVSDKGYLDAAGTHIKTNLKSVKFVRGDDFSPFWYHDFIKLWGMNGLAALAFWTASLFTYQIKNRLEFFPFLELTGEKESGKSTLVRFLWRLFGRDAYEGIDLLSTTTAGRDRYLSQLSNLPVVLLESDRESVDGEGRASRAPNQINWDMFKNVSDLNGVLSTRGLKTHGNDTVDLIFRGSLVITQNATIHGSDAILSRIVHLHFRASDNDKRNEPLVDALKQMKADKLGGYLRAALAKETEFLAVFFQYFQHYKERFWAHEQLTSGRSISGHAEIMAAAHGLKLILPELTDGTLQTLYNHLLERALSRQKRMCKDHPVLEQFWEAYYYLNHEEMVVQEEHDKQPRHIKREMLNHSADPQLIAINLNEFYERCINRKQEIAPMHILRNMLPESKRNLYIETKKTWSKREGKALNCWIFKKAKESV